MGLDSPPQLPPSKSSPPAKRAKTSPNYAKASPAVAGSNNVPHPSNHSRATIDEKLESMPMQRVSQMDLNNSIPSAYAGSGYATHQATFGTMFQHGSFGGPPPPGMHHNPPPQMPHQPPPPPQPQPSMLYGGGGGGPPNSGGGPLPYGPPQPIPTHYQTGSGPSHQSYYQHQPPSGRGGYYQGPP